MIRNYTLDIDGRIAVTTEYPIDKSAPTLDFSNDFDFAAQSDYRIVDGALVYDPLPTPTPKDEERIAALKAQLAATDYAVIKIAEGAATAEEYADVIAQRQAWRAEINALEASMPP